MADLCPCDSVALLEVRLLALHVWLPMLMALPRRCSQWIQRHGLRVWTDWVWKDVHYDGMERLYLSALALIDSCSFVYLRLGSRFRLGRAQGYHPSNNRADFPVHRRERRAPRVSRQSILYGDLPREDQGFACSYVPHSF